MRGLCILLLAALAACGQEAAPPGAVEPLTMRAPGEPATPAPAPIPAASTDRIAVIIELLPSEARAPHEGGSGAILLADPASPLAQAKNMALCRAALARDSTLDPAAARPVYWLTRQTVTALPNEDPCPARLEAYDYPRALALKRKLGLGDGPYLIAERADRGPERTAIVVDLTRVRAEHMAQALRFFRDDLAQGAAVWDPRAFAPAVTAERATRFFGEAPGFAAPVRLVRAQRNVGCAVEDLLDQCAS